MKTLVLGVVLASLSTAHAAVIELPVYPGARHTRIGGDLVIGGDYYRLAYFVTPDPLTKVAKHFQKTWTEQGYPVTVDGGGEEAVVSAFHTRQGLQRSVVLRRQGKQTLGFTVLKDLWATPPSRNELPALEGTLYAQDLRDRTGPSSLHRSAIVGQGLDAALANVRTRMKAEGYTLVRESGGEEGGSRRRVIEHERRGEHVLTTLTEIDAKSSAMTQSWVGGGK